MSLELIVGSALLLVSLSLNLGLSIFLIKKRKEKIEYTYDAQAILRDLVTGPTLLKIEYVDRADVLLRSPRHM